MVVNLENMFSTAKANFKSPQSTKNSSYCLSEHDYFIGIYSYIYSYRAKYVFSTAQLFVNHFATTSEMQHTVFLNACYHFSPLAVILQQGTG